MILADTFKEKQDALKKRILLEMTVDSDIHEYRKYLQKKKALIGLSKEESFELRDKGFATIEDESSAIKLLDATDYAICYCRFCDEMQPCSFNGSFTQDKKGLNSGIFIWCDECNRILFVLEHIENFKFYKPR